MLPLGNHGHKPRGRSGEPDDALLTGTPFLARGISPLRSVQSRRLRCDSAHMGAGFWLVNVGVVKFSGWRWRQGALYYRHLPDGPQRPCNKGTSNRPTCVKLMAISKRGMPSVMAY
jgi:hypothetical protein